jgi:hypothetical protein
MPDNAVVLRPALSPDDRTVAVDRTVAGNAEIWLLKLSRGQLRRVTQDQRFLMIVIPDNAPPPIKVILNWNQRPQR